MARANVYLLLPGVVQGIPVVMQTPSSVAMVNVFLGTLYVTRSRIVMMGPMKTSAPRKGVPKKLSNVTMVLVYQEPVYAMVVGSVPMEVMRLVVIKELRVIPRR